MNLAFIAFQSDLNCMFIFFWSPFVVTPSKDTNKLIHAPYVFRLGIIEILLKFIYHMQLGHSGIRSLWKRIAQLQ